MLFKKGTLDSIYMKTYIFFILPASKHNTTVIGAQKNTMVTPKVN